MTTTSNQIPGAPKEPFKQSAGASPTLTSKPPITALSNPNDSPPLMGGKGPGI